MMRNLTWLFGALAFVGCDLGQGLVDHGGALITPNAALVDRPGKRLIEGYYRDLVIDGSLEKGGHVLAIDQSEETQKLLILPYLEDEGCKVEPVLDFRRVSSRISLELPGLVAVQENADENGRGKIRFVGFDCQDKMAPVENARIPQLPFPSREPRGILILDGEGALSLVDPEGIQLTPIGKNVSLARATYDHLYTIEDGALVVRDDELKQLASLGKNVTEFVTFEGKYLLAAYRDDEGLHAWDGTETTLLSAGGCGIAGLGQGMVATYSDCEQKEALLYVPGAMLSLERDFIQLLGPAHTANLWDLRVYLPTQERDHLDLLVLAANDGTGGPTDLLLASIKEAALQELAEGETLAPSFKKMRENTQLVLSEYFQDYNGVSGTLLDFRRDEDGEIVEFYPLADKVAQIPGGSPFASTGVLANYDQERQSGDLVLLKEEEAEATMRPEITQEILARGVPIQEHYFDPETSEQLFLSAGDGEEFDVRINKQKSVRTIGADAYLFTARFMEQPRAVTYLAAGDGASELRVFLLNDEIELMVQRDVNEYRVIPWPAPGILYSVYQGENAGIWLSKAR